jgi:cytochrome oxidase Cu insertion factor (SCO1/SenC/PrrC family)
VRLSAVLPAFRRRDRRRPGSLPTGSLPTGGFATVRRRTLAAAIAAAAIAAAAIAAAGCGSSAMPGAMTAGTAATAQQRLAAANPDLDPGSSLGGIVAPDFTLTNQFGQRISLSAFRGKVVILAFTDSECTTVCPLTTQSMLAAKQLLGQADGGVQLIGVNANPAANKVSDVLAYSRSHGMVNQWDFLTGSDSQLRAVWKAYDIYVQIARGQVDHTPALFIIDTRGREQKIYLTTMAYASVSQAAQVMAQEAASLLPGHPALASMRSLAYISGLTPRSSLRLATLPSGSLILGPGRPHLVVFFATWLDETSDLRAQLFGLDQYVQAAGRNGLPGLVAVDETAAEPSVATVRAYLASLGRPLGYPVALDPTGRVADGYGVQDQPWFVLTSATGKILWQHDGWLPVRQLTAAVRTATR